MRIQELLFFVSLPRQNIAFCEFSCIIHFMGEREVVRQLPRNDVSITDADRRQAQGDFVAGLQAMTTKYDAMIENFALAAGETVGSKDETARMRGLIQFANAYKEFGLQVALGAIDKTSGGPGRNRNAWSFPWFIER